MGLRDPKFPAKKNKIKNARQRRGRDSENTCTNDQDPSQKNGVDVDIGTFCAENMRNLRINSCPVTTLLQYRINFGRKILLIVDGPTQSDLRYVRETFYRHVARVLGPERKKLLLPSSTCSWRSVCCM